MHEAARRFLESVIPLLPRPRSVLEIGSRNINGSCRDLFPATGYFGIDVIDGPGVDLVADGLTWRPDDGRQFDVVVATETLEHVASPAKLCANMITLCRPGGAIVVTAAGPGREPHSGIDGGELQAGEHYRNIEAAYLRSWLADCAVVLLSVNHDVHDVYCLAIR